MKKEIIKHRIEIDYKTMFTIISVVLIISAFLLILINPEFFLRINGVK